jgi:hypothetical protein
MIYLDGSWEIASFGVPKLDGLGIQLMQYYCEYELFNFCLLEQSFCVD